MKKSRIFPKSFSSWEEIKRRVGGATAKTVFVRMIFPPMTLNRDFQDGQDLRMPPISSTFIIPLCPFAEPTYSAFHSVVGNELVALILQG
jgi:hypothetical protein